LRTAIICCWFRHRSQERLNSFYILIFWQECYSCPNMSGPYALHICLPTYTPTRPPNYNLVVELKTHIGSGYVMELNCQSSSHLRQI